MNLTKKVLFLLLPCMLLFQSTNTYCDTASPSVNSGTKSITVYMNEDLFFTNPAYIDDLACGSYVLQTFEGLTRLDKNGHLVPGIAKSWKIENNGKKFVFKLRNATWSDGEPVTAYDFEYSWKSLLDPEKNDINGSLLYPVKNAREFAEGKAMSSSVGINALDSITLEVELNSTMPDFIETTCLPYLVPLRQDIVEQAPADWFTSAETFVTNGPFTMSKFDLNSQIILKKSDTYWDKNSIALTEIRWKYTGNIGQTLKDFDNRNVDIAKDIIPYSSSLVKAGKMFIYDIASVEYLLFNVTKKPLDNKNIRKAIALAIDRQSLIDYAKPGVKPATAVVPSGVKGLSDDMDFRKEAGNVGILSDKANISEAKKLLKAAGYPDGKGLPKLELLYNLNERNNLVMKKIQSQLKTALGITISLVGKENYYDYYCDRISRKYAMARFGWVLDYNDPMNFLSIWKSSEFSILTGWKNTKYNNYIKIAESTTDQKTRITALHSAEKIILDELPICPIYQCTSILLQNPRLSGVFVSPNNYLYLYTGDLKTSK